MSVYKYINNKVERLIRTVVVHHLCLYKYV